MHTAQSCSTKMTTKNGNMIWRCNFVLTVTSSSWSVYGSC